MIECSDCGGELCREINEWACGACGVMVSVEDGLLSFHPEVSGRHDGMDPIIIDELMIREEKHFWMKARRRLIGKIFDRYVDGKDKIIEIGAGTGRTAGYLSQKGFANISVGEIHLKGLEYARRLGIEERYQFDVLRTPFRDHFDVVALFDVLEHFDDDEMAVRAIHKMLKPGGKVIVTVPAHEWLRSRQDTIASHRRRYEVDALKALISGNGFRILKATAFFVSILPLLFFRKLMDRDRGKLTESDFKNRFRVNPILNFILEKLMNLEIDLFSGWSRKFGGSILLVAQKNDENLDETVVGEKDPCVSRS